MRRQTGFSLIELLIVVAIILILSAIAIPNFLRGRMAANEASAVESVRSINTAETAYAATYPNLGYSATLAALGGTQPCVPSSTGACLIDNLLANAIAPATPKSGYYFVYTQAGGAPATQYTLTVNAAVQNSSGQRSFYSDASNIIRFKSVGPGATATDSPIQ